jgi:D-serine deaminase-like pyridoxal phosphate-dependent protein
MEISLNNSILHNAAVHITQLPLPRHIYRSVSSPGVTIMLLIEVDAGQARCGHPTDAAGLGAITELAQVAATTAGVALKGIHCYHGLAQHVRSPQDRRALVLGTVAPAACAAVAALQAAGVWREGMSVTGGGTGTYEFEAESGAFNEVIPRPLTAGPSYYRAAIQRRRPIPVPSCCTVPPPPVPS